MADNFQSIGSIAIYNRIARNIIGLCCLKIDDIAGRSFDSYDVAQRVPFVLLSFLTFLIRVVWNNDCEFYGGHERTRTSDHYHVKVVLYQLSYATVLGVGLSHKLA